jgi:putative transposase
VGKNPTDRGKNGTKRSVIVEADGGPLGVVVDGANVHDAKLLERTIEAIVIQRPESDEIEQHLCLDKGYDNPTGHAAVLNAEYVPHIRRIGEEKLDENKRKTRPARRWVVERTIAWLNRCRAILVRYAKKSSNYLALIKIACILLWYRRAWRLDLLG